MDDKIATALSMANESLMHSANHLGEAFRHFAEAATLAFRQVGEAICSFVDSYQEQQAIKEIATPRQYHLYLNGSPRVRKKWRNALLRKARIAAKRKGGAEK